MAKTYYDSTEGQVMVEDSDGKKYTPTEWDAHIKEKAALTEARLHPPTPVMGRIVHRPGSPTDTRGELTREAGYRKIVSISDNPTDLIRVPGSNIVLDAGTVTEKERKLGVIPANQVSPSVLRELAERGQVPIDWYNRAVPGDPLEGRPVMGRIVKRNDMPKISSPQEGSTNPQHDVEVAYKYRNTDTSTWHVSKYEQKLGDPFTQYAVSRELSMDDIERISKKRFIEADFIRTGLSKAELYNTAMGIMIYEGKFTPQTGVGKKKYEPYVMSLAEAKTNVFKPKETASYSFSSSLSSVYADYYRRMNNSGKRDYSPVSGGSNESAGAGGHTDLAPAHKEMLLSGDIPSYHAERPTAEFLYGYYNLTPPNSIRNRNAEQLDYWDLLDRFAKEKGVPYWEKQVVQSTGPRPVDLKVVWGPAAPAEQVNEPAVMKAGMGGLSPWDLKEMSNIFGGFYVPGKGRISFEEKKETPPTTTTTSSTTTTTTTTGMTTTPTSLQPKIPSMEGETTTTTSGGTMTFTSTPTRTSSSVVSEAELKGEFSWEAFTKTMIQGAYLGGSVAGVATAPAGGVGAPVGAAGGGLVMGGAYLGGWAVQNLANAYKSDFELPNPEIAIPIPFGGTKLSIGTQSKIPEKITLVPEKAGPRFLGELAGMFVGGKIVAGDFKASMSERVKTAGEVRIRETALVDQAGASEGLMGVNAKLKTTSPFSFPKEVRLQSPPGEYSLVERAVNREFPTTKPSPFEIGQKIEGSATYRSVSGVLERENLNSRGITTPKKELVRVDIFEKVSKPTTNIIEQTKPGEMKGGINLKGEIEWKQAPDINIQDLPRTTLKSTEFEGAITEVSVHKPTVIEKLGGAKKPQAELRQFEVTGKNIQKEDFLGTHRVYSEKVESIPYEMNTPQGVSKWVEETKTTQYYDFYPYRTKGETTSTATRIYPSGLRKEMPGETKIETSGFGKYIKTEKSLEDMFNPPKPTIRKVIEGEIPGTPKKEINMINGEDAVILARDIYKTGPWDKPKTGTNEPVFSSIKNSVESALKNVIKTKKKEVVEEKPIQGGMEAYLKNLERVRVTQGIESTAGLVSGAGSLAGFALSPRSGVVLREPQEVRLGLSPEATQKSVSTQKWGVTQVSMPQERIEITQILKVGSPQTPQLIRPTQQERHIREEARIREITLPLDVTVQVNKQIPVTKINQEPRQIQTPQQIQRQTQKITLPTPTLPIPKITGGGGGGGGGSTPKIPPIILPGGLSGAPSRRRGYYDYLKKHRIATPGQVLYGALFPGRKKKK